MLTPGQVAKKANVTAQTIRNYSSDYADLLSPTARGGDGPRLYTDADVEILCTIAALRRTGVAPADIAGRFRNADVPPIVDATPQNQAVEPSKTAQDTYLAWAALQPTLNGRFEALERRVDAMATEQRARERAALAWARLEGAMAMAVVLAVLAWLAWLTVNGV